MVLINNAKEISGGITAPKGFKAAGMTVGIKSSSANLPQNPTPDKKDLGLIFCEEPCTTAALFTTNKVKAAPILLSQKHLADSAGKSQAIIVNSGNANACNKTGTQVAESMAALTADSLGIAAEAVLVASTGVIGQEMPVAPLESGIPQLAANLSATAAASVEVAEAIMTTDTFKKEFAVEVEISGAKVRVGGIAKGSGMINPNMATMLAFITTDVCITQKMLNKALCCHNSFNNICVDGDTSTNDMVCVMASGLAANREIATDCEDYDKFCDALLTITENLAREIARDGEGATKLIGCNVTRAPSEEIARAVAKSVISSSLVKAALGAADANWGRILCAVGYADADFDVNKVEIMLHSAKGTLTVCKEGKGVEFCEDEATEILSEPEIMLFIYLHSGDCGAIAWGCDLTAEYVRINADYRS
jgi:glutamate N-acetyltransferase/amino-acid N-acetyltransferase